MKYIKGDATNPDTKGPAIIIHCCNNIGKWGSGFVVALQNKWPITRKHYLNWFDSDKADDYVVTASGVVNTGSFKLGEVQFIEVEPNLWVANIIGQNGIYFNKGIPPIRYEAIRSGLKKVYSFAFDKKATIHMPRMGAGLAGGKWEEIERLLTEELFETPITVYDFIG